MSIIKNILRFVGLIIAVFLSLLGFLLFIIGIVESIVSMAICGCIITFVSIFMSVFIAKKIPKITRPVNKERLNVVAEDMIIGQSIFKDEKWLKENYSEIKSTESNTTSQENAILDNFDHLSGPEFEEWCANLLRNNGFNNVQVTKTSGDQGVDIIAQKSDIKYAIQCKCYSGNLGNSPIQEVHAGKSMYNCHIGVVMTNRHFTSGAKELANATGVLLWDREKLLQMMSNVQNTEKNISFNDNVKADKQLLEAIELALEAGKISTSLIQRRLGVGFGRAAQLIDKMEELGVVSKPDGAKPRKVLISKEDYIEMFI